MLYVVSMLKLINNYQNFQHNLDKYSFEVLLRYFLIILIGFGPLFILLINSKLKSKNLFFLNILKIY